METDFPGMKEECSKLETSESEFLEVGEISFPHVLCPRHLVCE